MTTRNWWHEPPHRRPLPFGAVPQWTDQPGHAPHTTRTRPPEHTQNTRRKPPTPEPLRTIDALFYWFLGMTIGSILVVAANHLAGAL